MSCQDPAEDKDLEEFKNLLRNLHMLLINTDTGGQSEFLDMLCALLPSTFSTTTYLIHWINMYFTDDKGNPMEKVKMHE